MLCPNCGTEIQQYDRFCKKCGANVEHIASTTPDAIPSAWPEWQMERKPLGKGSYGVVYKAFRRDHNVESYAAIKVISIPSDPSELESLRSEGLSEGATRTYLQGIVDDFVSEIRLMEFMKGTQNVVSVEDYKVEEKVGELGWNIYIRMELLKPFNTHICDKKLTEEDVVRLGCDICSALELCGHHNIIHRDIKPENIFVNQFGHYKLGDFGIARKMENLTGGLSQKGSPNYMAPEVAAGLEYDARVDICSLGIVLYRLLNGNRLPFLDTEKQLLNPNERKVALERRLRGETLPPPYEASAAMADLILRACAYDPNKRFATATEMKQALMSVMNGTYQLPDQDLDRTTSVRKPVEDLDRTTSVRKAPEATQNDPKPVHNFDNAPKRKGNGGTVAIVSILAGLILVLVAAIIVIALVSRTSPDEDEEATEPTATVAQTEQSEELFPENPYFDTFNLYNDYVLPGSDSSYKCYTDIDKLTEEALLIAEAEIEARHGIISPDADMQAYFEARSWYKPGSGSFTPNSYEQANLDLIRVYRAKKDGSLYRSGNGYVDAVSRDTAYVISNSSTHLLDGYDLRNFTEQQLCVARNEILARHGWLFEDKMLRDYFYSKEWYQPSVPGSQFDYSVLSTTEDQNIKLIKVYEKRAEGVTWSSNNPYKAVFYAYGNRDYIFYDSSSRYLTQEDLREMTHYELQIARNEICARNGYTFESQNLLEYFFHHDWYMPYTEPGGKVNYSAIEKANMELIQYAEEKTEKSGDVFIPDDYISDPF